MKKIEQKVYWNRNQKTDPDMPEKMVAISLDEPENLEDLKAWPPEYVVECFFDGHKIKECNAARLLIKPKDPTAHFRAVSKVISEDLRLKKIQPKEAVARMVALQKEVEDMVAAEAAEGTGEDTAAVPAEGGGPVEIASE